MYIASLSSARPLSLRSVFFFNDTATTEIYTLSLHDALPIYQRIMAGFGDHFDAPRTGFAGIRSEEHTSELQSRVDLVCRLLLEKKKTMRYYNATGGVIEAMKKQPDLLAAE